jgi:bifunctional ADP-heptose synthase (sugar kinase/adenylyltransferase)
MRMERKLAWFPSHIRNVADVSGAGDTVMQWPPDMRAHEE